MITSTCIYHALSVSRTDVSHSNSPPSSRYQRCVFFRIRGFSPNAVRWRYVLAKIRLIYFFFVYFYFPLPVVNDFCRYILVTVPEACRRSDTNCDLSQTFSSDLTLVYIRKKEVLKMWRKSQFFITCYFIFILLKKWILWTRSVRPHISFRNLTPTAFKAIYLDLYIVLVLYIITTTFPALLLFLLWGREDMKKFLPCWSPGLSCFHACDIIPFHPVFYLDKRFSPALFSCQYITSIAKETRKF